MNALTIKKQLSYYNIIDKLSEYFYPYIIIMNIKDTQQKDE